jgi:hypothetical protein
MRRRHENTLKVKSPILGLSRIEDVDNYDTHALTNRQIKRNTDRNTNRQTDKSKKNTDRNTNRQTQRRRGTLTAGYQKDMQYDRLAA